MTWLLGSGLIVALGAVITFALLGRRDASAKADAVSLADQYRRERDEAVRTLAVRDEQLATEKNLRAIAEAQRNAAQARIREQLAHLPPDEINAEVERLFATPLSIQPGNELERP